MSNKKDKSIDHELNRVIRAIESVVAAARPGVTHTLVLDLEVSKPGTSKELDMLWFKGHPDRSFRLRRIRDDEFLEMRRDASILVRQTGPGVREKHAFVARISPDELDALAAEESVLAEIWAAITSPTGVPAVHDVPFPEHVGAVH